MKMKPPESQISLGLRKFWAFLGGSLVKNPPASAVCSLGWGDPLEKEMATHSSILAWEIPWTEEPDRLYIVHGITKRQAWLCD